MLSVTDTINISGMFLQWRADMFLNSLTTPESHTQYQHRQVVSSIRIKGFLYLPTKPDLTLEYR